MRRVAAALALLVAGALGACDGDDVEPSTEAFCAAHAAVGASAFGTNTSGDPAALEAALDAAAPLFDELAASAPDAVAPDAAAVDEAFDLLSSYLAGVGFAPPAGSEVPADVDAALATVTASAYAGSPVGDFVEDNCGIDLEDPPRP